MPAEALFLRSSDDLAACDQSYRCIVEDRIDAQDAHAHLRTVRGEPRGR
jgi:hypothetical protein